MDIIVNGLHVKGLDKGKGPVALLLHGWQSDHTTFNDLAKVFSKKRIIAPDLPGFGGSQPPPEAWGVEEYARFVVALLKKLEVQEVSVVVGHSFGGRIALALLGGGLISTEKLVLLSSHGLPEGKTMKKRLYWLAAKSGKAATAVLPGRTKDRLRSRLYQSAGSEDYLQSGHMKKTFIKVINQDATNDIKHISAPVLLIYGGDDTTTPVELGRRIAGLLPDSKLVEAGNAGHYVHLDAPAEVAEQIKRFVA